MPIIAVALPAVVLGDVLPLDVVLGAAPRSDVATEQGRWFVVPQASSSSIRVVIGGRVVQLPPVLPSDLSQVLPRFPWPDARRRLGNAGIIHLQPRRQVSGTSARDSKTIIAADGIDWRQVQCPGEIPIFVRNSPVI
jgi:hypothetical protein